MGGKAVPVISICIPECEFRIIALCNIVFLRYRASLHEGPGGVRQPVQGEHASLAVLLIDEGGHIIVPRAVPCRCGEPGGEVERGQLEHRVVNGGIDSEGNRCQPDKAQCHILLPGRTAEVLIWEECRKHQRTKQDILGK